ncbi:MAG: nucleotidyltransferase domain-containing protein [Acidimicrobiia bacterium]
MDSSAVRRVAAVIQALDLWWALAGGWAIDVWLGEHTREHHDIEVVVRRDDQTAVWDALHDDWDLLCIDPPGSGWRRWDRNVRIVEPAFQVKARSASDEFEFDLFLESTSDDLWVFRRDSRIRRSLDSLTTFVGPVPVVVPEVQLLYMAKSDEPKNRHDLDVTVPRLDARAAAWLRDALGIALPGHAWISEL